MSREFGSYYAPGYFHAKIENAKEDAERGGWLETRALVSVLDALYEAAYVCASVEAQDMSATTSARDRWRKSLEATKAAIDNALLESQDGG